MNISVVIPTYKRPGKLTNCLESLTKQTLPPHEILITHRPDDHQSIDVIKKYQDFLPLRSIVVSEPGVIHAENRALSEIKGEITSFIDDDGIAPTNWLERISQFFKQNPDAVGLGGPDYIFKYPKMRKKMNIVGKILWYGKVVGNHHHQVPSQYVQTLKGTNMSFRSKKLMPIDINLCSSISEGNGVFWELDLCLSIAPQPNDLFFDRELEIQHDSDHSHVKLLSAVLNGAHNLSYVLFKHYPFHRRIIFLIYYILIGNTQIFGLARTILELTRNSPIAALKKFYYSQLGMAKGIRTLKKTKCSHT